MAFTIETETHKGAEGRAADWVTWLKTPDGIHIYVAIGFQADEAQANKIVRQLAGLERHDE